MKLDICIERRNNILFDHYKNKTIFGWNLQCNSAMCINFAMNEDCEEELANGSPSMVSCMANIHKSVLSVDDSANFPFSFCFHLQEKDERQDMSGRPSLVALCPR